MENEHDGLPRQKHWDAISMFDNEEIIAQRRELESSFQRGNEVIYCRPTDVGLKCISTRQKAIFILGNGRDSIGIANIKINLHQRK